MLMWPRMVCGRSMLFAWAYKRIGGSQHPRRHRIPVGESTDRTHDCQVSFLSDVGDVTLPGSDRRPYTAEISISRTSFYKVRKK